MPAQSEIINFSTWMWVAFAAFVLGMLVLDLGVLNRKAHVVRFREAVIWSSVCVGLAALFNTWLYFRYGSQVAQEFLAGYLLEEALSVDNIFVFIMIFAYFEVKPEYQHRLLFWGIIGALVLRGAMIAAGSALVHFPIIMILFGLLLIYTGVKMAFHDPATSDPSKSLVYRWAQKLLPIAEGDHGQRFFVRVKGKLHVTMLFLVLLVIETTDLLFALDSIPAVFAVTKSPFIVYTSNVFAILGLRALYFVLAGIMDMFRYLKYGLSVVLVFVGIKMLLNETSFKIPISVSLGTIAGILIIAIIASVIATRHERKAS